MFVVFSSFLSLVQNEQPHPGLHHFVVVRLNRSRPTNLTAAWLRCVKMLRSNFGIG